MRLPICGCGRVMSCTTTGLSVLVHTEDGMEYQLWASDEYTCSQCGAKVAIVNAALPIAEHWQPGFDRAKRAASSPDGRRKLFNAFYRNREMPLNVAGVSITGEGVYLELTGGDGEGLTKIHAIGKASTVDSTTPPAEDAQHHDSSNPGDRA